MAPHDPSPVDTSTDDTLDELAESRRGMIAFLVVVAACFVVVAGSVVLLVVQPGKSSGNQSGQCFDSAMQMEMPCNFNS